MVARYFYRDFWIVEGVTCIQDQLFLQNVSKILKALEVILLSNENAADNKQILKYKRFF